jgi:hypothetical protein
MWTLIIIIIGSVYSGTTVATASIPGFATQDRCQAGISALTATHAHAPKPDLTRIEAICVQTGF